MEAVHNKITCEDYIMKTLSQRRKALESQRHSVVFYGGWYVVDNQNPSRTFSINTRVARDLNIEPIEMAIQIAEHRNEKEARQ